MILFVSGFMLDLSELTVFLLDLSGKQMMLNTTEEKMLG